LGSAGADADGARSDRSGGHLGERPAGADLVADDLRQAACQDVQVVLAAADALVKRLCGRVVLDQCAAEGGKGAVGRDGAAADRAAARVRRVAKPPAAASQQAAAWSMGTAGPFAVTAPSWATS
jgi:hypothetical protein